MSQKRDNCIILLVDPPEADKISQELKTAFGPERAAHVNSDLLSNAYKLAKGFKNAIFLLSYQKTSRHPDLTWLDQEDPGFLEAKTTRTEDRIKDAFRLAFFTGAKKAVLLSHLSPGLKSEWLTQAFDETNERTVSIGSNQDGTFCLLALTQANLEIFETPGFSHGKSAENLIERAKKHKLSVFSTPETYSVTGEDTLLKWMEEKEALPPLFSHPAPAVDNKKHHKRHTRHQETPVQAPPEEPPL